MMNAMSDTSRFRFAMQMTSASTGAEWLALARRFEDEGYDVVSMPDHLGPQFAPVPALAAIAATTSRVQLSMFVLANDHRHPAVLAKEMTTLDVLSEGRLELGLGAGWHQAEHRAQGITFDPPGIRIDRLAEAVTILKRAFAGETFSFHGTHYTLEDLEVLPKPVRAGGIPLVLGGGGRRMLSLAAREADIVSLSTNNRSRSQPTGATAGLSFETVHEQVGWVRDAAGDRFDDLTLNIRVLGVAIGPDHAAAATELAQSFQTDVATAEQSPFLFIGSVEQVCDHAARIRQELGISYFTISQRHADHVTPVLQRLAGH
jgi:probable F420-dependent oxidoreductase